MLARRSFARPLVGLALTSILLAAWAEAGPQVFVSGQQKAPGPIPSRPRSLYVPPAPQLDPVDPTPTAAASIAISGTAAGAAEVRVQAPSGSQTLPLGGTGFAFDVPLVADQVNPIYVFSRSVAGVESPPAKVVVVQDSSPPLVVIEYPADGADIYAASVDVLGKVTDTLNGNATLGVSVNGIVAQLSAPVNGITSFLAKGVPLNAAGQITQLTATAQDAAGNVGSSPTFEVVQRAIPPGSSTTTSAGGNDQTGVVGSELPQPLAVEVLRSDGSPYAGKVVTFEVTRGDGKLATTPGASTKSRLLQVLTDTSGVAQAWLTLGSEAGLNTNRVAVATKDSLGTVYFVASATSGTPSQINVGSGGVQLAEASRQANFPLRARVADGRNGVEGVPVTFTVVEGGGSIAGQSQAIVPTDAEGNAEVELTLGPASGANVVEATFGNPPAKPAVFVVEGLEREPGAPTRLRGSVFDHATEPLEGVTVAIRVDGVAVQTTSTDLLGRFEFGSIAESGLVELEIDGATATRVGGPGGYPVPADRYPVVVLKTLLIQGAANTLPRPVKLPPLIPANDVVVADPSIQGAELFMQGVDGMSMVVAPGSLLDAQGQPVTTPVTYRLNQVRFDSLFLPLPDGAATPFVWSLLLEGAPDDGPGDSTFATPIQVEEPNVGGLEGGTTGTFLGPEPGGESYAATASGAAGGDGGIVRADPGSGLLVSGDGPTDAGGEAVFRGQLGLGSFVPPYSETFSIEVPAQCSATPGLIPPTTLLPIVGGTIRDDSCGSGAFGAPRGKGLNHGVDIVGSLGAGVLAVYDGTVVAVQSDCSPDPFCSETSRDCGGGYGNFVVIEHSTGAPANARFYTAYTQLDAVFVSKDDAVLAGSVVGTLGQTGNANPACFSSCAITPYVHFEISATVPPLAGDRPRCNPQDYLVNLPPPSGSAPPAPEFSPYEGEILFEALGGVSFPTSDELVVLDGLPALPNGQVSLRSVWYAGKVALRMRSGLSDTAPGQTILVTDLAPDPVGAPAELSSDAPQQVLTLAGQQTQVTVTALDSGGTPRDVTQRSDGTVYTTTNPDIVTVDQDGQVTAVGSGRAFVSATNDGLTTTVELTVDLVDPGTTVVGFVTLLDGTPVVGAEVTVVPGSVVGTSQPAAPGLSAGWFSIPGVPSNEGPIAVFVRQSSGGQELTGSSLGIEPVPDGLSDAGVIAIDDAIYWSSSTGGSWSDPTKWSTGSVPPAGSRVVIDRPGALTITLGSVSGALESLRCKEDLVIVGGGQLRANQALLVEGSLTLQGGRLFRIPVVTLPGSPVSVLAGGGNSRLDQVTLQGEVEVLDAGSPVVLEIAGGLTLVDGKLALTSASNEVQLSFVGSQQVLGVGEIALTSGTAQSRIATGGATLTLTSDILVHGAGSLGDPGDVVANQGTIAADVAGQALVVDGTGWSSSGKLTALNGGILRLAGTFLNTAKLSSVGSVVDLAGTFSTADLGFTSFSGGEVWISGTLQPSVLDIRGSTAAWNLVGATLSGVTLVTDPGQVVGVATGAPSTLDGVTLAGEIELASSASGRTLVVVNDLTLDGGTIRLASAGNLNTLQFSGAQTVTGSGDLVLATVGFPNLVSAPSGLLTIGPSVTVRGAGTLGGAGQQIQNLGTIRAELSGGLLVVEGAGWTTNGTLQAGAGAVLQLAGTYTLGGVLDLDQGTITTTGTLTLPPGVVLRGSGTIGTDLLNTGLVQPGGPGAAGRITVLGDYTQPWLPTLGTIEIEIGGLTAATQYDQVVSTGVGTPDGRAIVTLLNGFSPVTGDVVDPLVYSGCGGACFFVIFSQTPPIWAELPSSTEYRLEAL